MLTKPLQTNRLKQNTLNKYKVENLINANNNRTTNQFIITITLKQNKGELLIFQSYDSVIATILLIYGKPPIIHIDELYYNYSTTTIKYRNRFFDHYGFFQCNTTKKLTKAIQNKEVILTNLN